MAQRCHAVGGSTDAAPGPTGVATHDLLFGPGAFASAAGYAPEGKNLPTDSITIHGIASQPIGGLSLESSVSNLSQSARFWPTGFRDRSGSCTEAI